MNQFHICKPFFPNQTGKIRFFLITFVLMVLFVKMNAQNEKTNETPGVSKSPLSTKSYPGNLNNHVSDQFSK